MPTTLSRIAHALLVFVLLVLPLLAVFAWTTRPRCAYCQRRGAWRRRRIPSLVGGDHQVRVCAECARDATPEPPAVRITQPVSRI